MEDEARLALLEMLDVLEKEGFYGTLTLSFRAGRVYVVKQEKTILLPSPKNGHAKYTT